MNIDATKLTDLQKHTTLTREFGADYLRQMDISPEMHELDKLMKLLTVTQREIVLTQIKALVQANVDAGRVEMPAASRSRKRR